MARRSRLLQLAYSQTKKYKKYMYDSQGNVFALLENLSFFPAAVGVAVRWVKPWLWEKKERQNFSSFF